MFTRSLAPWAPAYERFVRLEPLADERDVYGALSDAYPKLVRATLFDPCRRNQLGNGTKSHLLQSRLTKR